MVDPAQIFPPAGTAPIVGVAGLLFTVICILSFPIQPPLEMESIIYNVPAATPVTIPVEVTVASVVFLLIQVPPVVESDNVIVLATQTALLPVICDIASVAFITTSIESEIVH